MENSDYNRALEGGMTPPRGNIIPQNIPDNHFNRRPSIKQRDTFKDFEKLHNNMQDIQYGVNDGIHDESFIRRDSDFKMYNCIMSKQEKLFDEDEDEDDDTDCTPISILVEVDANSDGKVSMVEFDEYFNSPTLTGSDNVSQSATIIVVFLVSIYYGDAFHELKSFFCIYVHNVYCFSP